MFVVEEFNKTIETIGDAYWQKSEELPALLWPTLNELRQRSDDLLDWKFKAALDFAKLTHTGSDKLFKNLPWETSFTLAFMLGHYR